MSTNNWCTYNVEGRGLFPFDMLRYDAAWPAASRDAAYIDGREQRKIGLASWQGPTIERWASFGWRVASINGIEIPAPAAKSGAACTYPACRCIVSTSTSQPVPVCPKLGD